MELAMENFDKDAPGTGDGLPDCDYLMEKRLTDDGLVDSDEGMDANVVIMDDSSSWSSGACTSQFWAWHWAT